MIRSSTLLASQLASTELRCVRSQQKRFKSFVRKVDKNNDVYYTVAKREDRPQDPESTQQNEFFEMPDLLLDLDAEGNRNVRTSDEADEERMKSKWDINPKRLVVQARLKEFEREIFEARRKFSNTISHQTSMWRLSQHDILTAALFGSPGSIEHGRVENTEPEQQLQHSYTQQNFEFIGSLGVENGLPHHAAKKDSLFLEWLRLRRGALVSIERRVDRPCPSHKLVKALNIEPSIKGVRRMIFQNLAERTDIASYTNYLGFASGRSPNIPREIRDACLRICNDSEGSEPYLETLSFLGNLAERFSANGIPLGATLHGLALRISAEAGLPATSGLWIHRGYADNVWVHGTDVSEDIVAAMDAFLGSLRYAEGAGLNQPHERQLLFQVLTGLDEHSSLAPDSFRTLSTFYLHMKNNTPIEQSFAIFERYITLLGQLGAIRTLWHEGQAPANWARTKLTREKRQGEVDALFHKALASALQVAVIPPEETAADLSYEESVTLDYHSIASQNPNTWFETRDDTATSSISNDEMPIGETLPPLTLSYNEWISKIREILQNRTTKNTARSQGRGGVRE
ncbi:hypothetical protein PT974_08426 [Cladobotryum mycophilum]|uniref:Uncharacterized protein n=1 Tax=Cladobotryum mycophilum TaxID=491253 RepID=A0ABR0SDB8_9HYPO